MSEILAHLETARMDRHYRFQRHFYDLTRRYFLAGRLNLIDGLQPEPGQCVLEIGCGTAWNLTQIARFYPEAKLFGIDISRHMLATAAASLQRKGFSHRIMLGHGDATGFDPVSVFGPPRYDRVVLSYALSMIPSWEKALMHAVGLIAAGGSLHIVDFGQCERLPGFLRRGLYLFLDHYDVTPRLELQARIEQLIAVDPTLSLEFDQLYFGYACSAVVRREPVPSARA
jgi:S-adenosylmethionine-diacylgycerolhomoserine-N-methlytransferase